MGILSLVIFFIEEALGRTGSYRYFQLFVARSVLEAMPRPVYTTSEAVFNSHFHLWNKPVCEHHPTHAMQYIQINQRL